MADAREAAFNILQQWTTLDSPPQVPERAGPHATWEGLSSRDRAFAFDLLTAVLRWRNLLDSVIASRLRQPLESLDPPVRALLWLGSCQLLLQSGTADYAAVDTTVAMALKYRSTAKTAGLVNAVLRGITRLAPARLPIDQAVPLELQLSRRAFALDYSTQLTFSESVFPDPVRAPDAHLSIVRSHPAAYVSRLRMIYGGAMAGALLLHNNLRPVVTLRSDESALQVPAAAGLAAHAEAPRFLVAAAGWNETLERLVGSGKLSPQDPTSARPVARVAEMAAGGQLAAPRRIIDLCAGLGTKTLQLARAFPKSQVIGADIDAGKLQRLAARARAVGQGNIATLPAETAATPKPAETYDLVVVDVPC
jgi:16S rRNA (cytosine967-C5)-methyltransferase